MMIPNPMRSMRIVKKMTERRERAAGMRA